MKITEILVVVDTRDYEEQGDKIVPIPGSGIFNECFRCGKQHEIHAHVKLEDNSTVIVGTGCMKSESMELQKQIKTKTSTAKRKAALLKKKEVYQELYKEFLNIWEKVNSLTIPEVVESLEIAYGIDQIVYRCGDSTFYSGHGKPDKRERHNGVVENWKRNRAMELGETLKHRNAKRDLEEIEKKLSQNNS